MEIANPWVLDLFKSQEPV